MKNQSTISLHARVIDMHGRVGTVVALENVGAEGFAWLQLDDCPKIRVPLDWLPEQPDGTYRLPFSFEITGKNAQIVIPVQREELRIDKRQVDTGVAVLIHKTVAEREQVVDESLLHDDWKIERVARGSIVDESALPRTRYEGETLVVPVLEEVMIFQKQTLLKEEVRITNHRREEHSPQTFVLRTEHVTVEHIGEKEQDEA